MWRQFIKNTWWQSLTNHHYHPSLLRVAIIIVIYLTNQHQCDNELIRDFSIINYLPDGEVETRVYYKGITGKETTVAKGSVDDIKFRQLTDNHTLIQLIYNNDELKDCEILHRRQHIEKFLNQFKNDLNYLLTTTSNLTINNYDNQPQLLSKQFINEWFNFTIMKRKCRQLHKEFKKFIKNTTIPHRLNPSAPFKIRTKRSMLIMPGTLWCGSATDANTYTQLGHMSKTDRCCRRHDYCRISIPGLTMKYNYYNYSPFTLSHCYCDKRSRRDISDLLRIPGTKWCGKGYSADKYTRLGGFSRTDKCCRRHDMACPFWIGAFDTKYGLFNWRVNTIMHCSCDERFRACLKMVDSSDANLVGKLFFNVVQTKCFILKPKKRCTKMSWWGKCEKFKYEKQAILRDNLPY